MPNKDIQISSFLGAVPPGPIHCFKNLKSWSKKRLRLLLRLLFRPFSTSEHLVMNSMMYSSQVRQSSQVNCVLVNHIHLIKSVLVDRAELWGRRRASQRRHPLRGSLSARAARFWRVFCKQEDEKWANVSCSGRPFQTHRRLLLLSNPIGAISLRLPWG